jgi:hypothetical protein
VVHGWLHCMVCVAMANSALYPVALACPAKRHPLGTGTAVSNRRSSRESNASLVGSLELEAFRDAEPEGRRRNSEANMVKVLYHGVKLGQGLPGTQTGAKRGFRDGNTAPSINAVFLPRFSHDRQKKPKKPWTPPEIL